MIIECKCGLRVPMKPHEFPLRCSCGKTWDRPDNTPEIPLGYLYRTFFELDYLTETFCNNCRGFRDTQICWFDRGCKQAKSAEEWRTKAMRANYQCPVARWNPHIDVLYGINPSNQEWIESKAAEPVSILNAGGISAALLPVWGVPLESTEAAIRRTTPKVVVNCAMFLGSAQITTLANSFRQTIFVTTCHSSQSDLARNDSWLARQWEFIELAKAVPNCLYGLVDEREGFYSAFGCDGVIHFGNCVPPLDVEPRKKIHAPPRVSLICEWRPLKNLPNQLIALALVQRRQPIHVVLAIKKDRENQAVRMADAISLDCETLPWQSWRDYRRTVAHDIDAGLQVSFTESFNFISLDHLQAGKPVIGSPAIRFLPPEWQANPDDPEDIAKRLLDVLGDYNRASRTATAVARDKEQSANAAFWRSIRHLLNGAAPCKT